MKQNKTQDHQVSLKRPDGWYGADNEMVTVFAPLIGPYAFGVYHLLKQRSFLREKERSISQAQIGQAMGMSKEAAANALQTLKNYFLVEEIPTTAVNRAPRYEVVHAKDVLAAHPEFQPQNGHPHFPHSQAEFQLRAKRKRGRNSSHVADGIPATDGRNSSHGRLEFQPPNKEVTQKERKTRKDKHPLPPLGGGKTYLEVPDETKNEAPVPPGLVRGVPEVLASSADRQPRERATTRAGSAEASAGSSARDGMTPVAATLANLLGEMSGRQERFAAVRAEVLAGEMQLKPRQLAQIFLQELHEQFATAYSIPPGIAALKGAAWEDPFDAWKRCFDHVGVGEIEADGDQWVVVLETRRPKDLQDGLTKYAAKVQLAMKKSFGREVQLVPRLEAA